ncbi:MAG: sigma-54 interaction domain-containing protein, partial [Polyangiaceae bacterium]
DLGRLGGGLRPEDPKFGDIVGRSESMTDLISRARKTVPLSLPVLIEGESGTGKELLATAIHKEGPRASKPFIVINCGAIPANLLEAELFGFKKGTFTGASADRPGLFEQAAGGTIFLDEVGELPLDAQVKLLRVLQEKKVRRIGDETERKVDARVIAATNRDLVAEMNAGRFREDLYYRLAILTLRTPPLREREGDLVSLIDHVLKKLQETLEHAVPTQKKLSPAARNLLLRHAWRGNVRELEAVVARAYVWAKRQTIDDSDIRQALLQKEYGGGGRAGGNVLGRSLDDGFSLEETIGEVARHYLERAMKESGGNKTKAASLVGFGNYQTLKNWLTKYGVES